MVKRKNLEDIREESGKRITRNMSKCKVCLEEVGPVFVDESQITVLCKECKERFHGPCVGISSNFFYNLINSGKKGWTCYLCNQNRLQFLENICKSVSDIDKRSTVNSNMISGLRVSVDEALIAMNDRIEQVRQEVANVSRIQSESPVPSRSTLSGSDDLSSIQAIERKNNLIIQNVPFVAGEDALSLRALVVKTAACFGYQLNGNDILTVVRLRGKPATSTGSSENLSRPFSTSLLAKFTDVTIKDDFFSNYITAVVNQKFVLASNVGLGSNQRIFINHHMSHELTRVKIKATEMKKAGLVERINARYDCVRVCVNDKWHRVTSLDSLAGLSSL